MTLQQGPVPVSGVFPVGVTFAPSGDWASGNPAFAISRGSPGRVAPYAWTRPPVSWHAIFPFSPFGSRVSHQIQRPLLPSLPATRAIQRCASWRSYNTKRPHRALQLRPPRPQSPVPEPVYGKVRRRPILGGVINEYESAA